DHNKTLVNINNHLVNGKGNDLEGGLSGGGVDAGKLDSLKKEILRELERRVSLSCSFCQAGVEDLRRQQQTDRERIHALEKQLNVMDSRYRLSLDGLRRDVTRSQGCCDAVHDLKDRITSAERNIDTALENYDIVENRLDRELSGERNAVLTEDKLDGRLRDLERRINGSVHQTEESCSHVENVVKDLKTVFLERFDDQSFRISDVEEDVGLVKDQVTGNERRIERLENATSHMGRRMEECGCNLTGGRGGGGGGVTEGRGVVGGQGGSVGGGGGRGDGGGNIVTGGGGARGGSGGGDRREEEGGFGGFGGGGVGLPGTDNTTEKSLAWRVVANEDQIHRFITTLKDLSVSGDSLHDKVVDLSHDVRQIKALTGDRGEHFNRIVTEIETLGHGCGETCGRVEDELRRLKNHTQNGLDRLQVHIKTLQGRVASEQGSCSQVCSNLQEEVGKLRQDVERCTGQCKNGLDTSTGMPGADANVPKLSFSAALTNPMERPGTIVFDKIFVNEGDFYDPVTGVFTAPVDGHYFFSAVLTGHKNEKIEAVLSKSNYGMARVDSGGYQPEGLENKPVAEANTPPGSLAVFSVILPLQVQDTVCIDLVMGKLAHSVEPLTIFNGVLLYEDM
ncbi:hypothetical protein CRUP_019541, partial [Coryphaenoides rupestris]